MDAPEESTPRPVVPTIAELLDFEATHPGTHRKHEQIRSTFHLTPTRYYQLLNQALDNPAAAAHDPITTHRLLRLRDRSRTTRTARLPERTTP